jgi:hypothetical protein
MNFRMLGPIVSQTNNINGRIYSGAPGATYDIIDGDADVLGASGWTRICPSGPTSARPTTSQAVNSNYFAGVGTHFFDTNLSKLIVFDGATWRDPATGAAV